MQYFLGDLHALLATWAELFEPYLNVFFALYIFVPFIYHLKKHPPKHTSRFSLPFGKESKERYEQNYVERYEILEKNIIGYYTYTAGLGIISGFMLQAGTDSISSLALIPIFSIGGVLLISIQLIIRRERVQIIRKKRARLHGPKITDPDELKEVETLQRFVDVLEKKQAQEDKQ